MNTHYLSEHRRHVLAAAAEKYGLEAGWPAYLVAEFEAYYVNACEGCTQQVSTVAESFRILKEID